MKQIIKCFSLLFLAIGTVACSGDDNDADNNENKELVIIADKIEIPIGESVLFSALDGNNKEVKDVEFYVDGIKVTQKYKFDKKGLYYAVAKKKGYKNSYPIDIAVMDTDGEAILSKIKMTVDRSTIVMGDRVTFEVKIDGKVATSGYSIRYYQGDAIESNTLILDKPGKYKFVATKEDYANSEVIEVDVKLKSTVTPQTFTINGNKYEITEVELANHIDSDLQPILYYDTRGAFYAYDIVVKYSVSTFTFGTLKVRVPHLVESIPLPHEVDKSRISLWKGLAFEDSKRILDIKENELDPTSSVHFDKKNIDGVGKLDLDFRSKDHSMEIKYSGVYSIYEGPTLSE